MREKVGGDWCDAVAAGDHLTVVIGEVVGHDMSAAARMGQLRSMLRAYLVDRRDPPSVLLRRLEAANHALGSPTTATAVLAVISAGLPPGSTLLLHTDGLVERAGQVIDEGLQHLYRRLRRCGEADLDDLLTGAHGPAREQTDDIAMLAVRIPRL